MLNPLRAHPRLVIGIAAGIAFAAMLPDDMSTARRVLLGWNAGTWLYLLTTWTMMARATHERMRQRSLELSESITSIVGVAIVAVAATLWAIVVEIINGGDASKAGASADPVWPHVALTGATLLGSWALLATLFALSYASLYYHRSFDAEAQPHHERGGGLDFPGAGRGNPPTYLDFMYFAFTLAATSQTSDVAVSSRRVRRWVFVQTVLSFIFNTMLLALAINAVAGLK